MLSRLADFYLIVNPSPSDSVVTQRKAAITAFLPKLDEFDALVGCVDLAVGGLSSTANAQQKVTAEALLVMIQKHQPALAGDILTNAIDVRVCAGVAVGEYLLRKHRALPSSTLAASALVVAALQTRPRPSERYVAQFLEALLGTARAVLEHAAGQARSRPKISFGTFDGSEPEAVEGALREIRDSVDKNLRTDREELQVLWWVFGGASKLLAKPFSSVDPATRALAAAAELADISLLPPPNAASQFLASVIKEEAQMSLRQFVATSATDILKRFGETTGDVTKTLRHHPSLLPLTWVLARKLDSGVSDGWEGEFQQKTGISPDQDRSLSHWARQAFDECVAARLANQLNADEEEDEDEDETGEPAAEKKV